MGALTHRITNIPEHEQIASRSAGESGNVFGRSSYQPVAETCGRMNHLRAGRIGGLDAFGKLRINRDAAIACKFNEARGKPRIAGIEGILDFSLGHWRRQHFPDCNIREQRRVVPRIEEHIGLMRARQHHICG